MCECSEKIRAVNKALEELARAQEALHQIPVPSSTITGIKGVGAMIMATGGDDVKLGRVLMTMMSVVAKGKLTSRDLKDFMMQRVPIMHYLSQTLGVSAPEVRDMVSAGNVTSEHVKAAIRLMGDDPRFKGV